jgi:hypothetical protein
VGFDQGLTKVDQKESLGFVGDVFKVMAQVDRRLTKVNTVDLLIRVNKLGRKPGASQMSSSHPRWKYPAMWSSLPPEACVVMLYILSHILGSERPSYFSMAVLKSLGI